MSKNVWSKLIVAMVILVIIGLSFFLPIKPLFAQFIENVRSLGNWAGLIYGLVYVFACLFFPASLLTLGAGFLFGVVQGSIIVSLAATAGAGLAFFIGRYMARDIVRKKIAGNSKFQQIDDAVGESGWKIVGLTRLSPIFPFILLNYAYGLTKVSFAHYLLASWIGMLPGTVMYVYFGTTLSSLTDLGAAKDMGNPYLFWGGLAATVIVTLLITKIARQALLGRL